MIIAVLVQDRGVSRVVARCVALPQRLINVSSRLVGECHAMGSTASEPFLRRAAMRRIQSVLVGTDFSGSASNAAERAARTAAEHSAALQILHVMSEPALAVLRDAYRAPAETERSLRAQAETELEELRTKLASAYGVAAKTVLRLGVTRTALVEEAAHVDLLVLGARGTNPV